jgi:hypothetical protein
MILLAEIFLILIYGIRNDDECQAMCESLPSIRNGKEIILEYLVIEEIPFIVSSKYLK